ncbi:hypothetical protein FPHYL_12341 [Fusarium phyllophilum]|uniref:Uncharacterized protein n=1 Tax=Fusarium phyllophilum TaxID=47803 RepID=A0A8H5MRX7_9HYPO|nr:hypothetical protein FPHYL_12341 [Fusarium phyllophilum]
MTSSAVSKSDGPSIGGVRPIKAVPSTILEDNGFPESHEKLKEGILRTVMSLRTALPTSEETSDFDAAKSATRPRFGDLSHYNIAEVDEKYLWETEVHRIASSLEKYQQPLDSCLSHELGSKSRLGSELEIIRNAGIRDRETSRREPDLNENNHFVITALAKYSTKLKVLSRELPEYGVGALNRYSDVRRLLRDYPFAAAENPSEISLKVTAVDRYGDGNLDPERGPEDRYVATYASDMITISNWLFRLLWHILKDLNTRNTRDRHTDEFEVSSVIFAQQRGAFPPSPFRIDWDTSPVLHLV